MTYQDVAVWISSKRMLYNFLTSFAWVLLLGGTTWGVAYYLLKIIGAFLNAYQQFQSSRIPGI